MKKINYEFSPSQIQSLVGKIFVKYRCDEFIGANVVNQIVGLFIEDKVISLRANFERVDYLGEPDDIAYMKFSFEKESDITSAFVDTPQYDNPVNSKIISIKLFNDHQTLIKDGKVEYDAKVTRAILFKLEDEQELLFEKENWVYSDCIEINKGYSLENKLSDVNKFCEGWSDLGVEASCSRTISEFR